MRGELECATAITDLLNNLDDAIIPKIGIRKYHLKL